MAATRVGASGVTAGPNRATTWPPRPIRNFSKFHSTSGSIDFVADLPRDDNGKLYKRLIRERYWQGHSTLIS
jgi:acyl-coenzyme A synthetase/AMP-(fatty) acid ligase